MPTQDSLALLVSLALGALFLGEIPRVGLTGLVGAALALALVGDGIGRLARTGPAAAAADPSGSEDLGEGGRRLPAGVPGLRAQPAIGPSGGDRH
jgi:hypothetical protein